MARIVLAHGILGFGNLLPTDPVAYFNCVKAIYEAHGHDVFCPSVRTLGSLQKRSEQLAEELLGKWPDDGQPIYLLAHSMGGLDCRKVLAEHPEIARRVRRLVTVATPHFGSPVADAALADGPFGLPNPAKVLAAYLEEYAGALEDLRTREDLQDLAVAGFQGKPVDYLCIGCDAAETNPKSPVFAATALLGKFGEVPNDGVVSLDSSSHSNHRASLLSVWPVDHGGAIGWPSGLPFQAADAAVKAPAEHLARYEALLATLLK